MEEEKSSQKLFEEFPATSKEQWRQQTLLDLKGADFDKKLVWPTLEGFNVQPYYDSSDLKDLAYLRNFENNFVNLTDGTQGPRAWSNRELIKVETEESANQLALEALQQGADGIIFDITGFNHIDFERLLNNIQPHHCSISFFADHHAAVLIRHYFDYNQSLNIDPKELRGSINYDPLRHFCVMGKLPGDAFEVAASNIEIAKSAPEFYGITINSSQFLNAGATAVQELAFTLNMAAEYIDQLSELALSMEHIIPSIEFSMAIGTNYFFEIAKLRAFRILFYQLTTAYGMTNFNPGTLSIHSHSSIWSKSIIDPHVNMLRNTTEAMSAIIGGCNSITIDAYDNKYVRPNSYSRRISRNISSIIKEESYLDKVADPSAGAYYIEKITDELVQHSWHLFKEIEAKGGFMKSFESGIIQQEIKKVRVLKEQRIASRRDIFVGANQYPNLNEHIDPDLIKVQVSPIESNIEVLPQQSGALGFEELRMKTESYVKIHGIASRPKVFLSLIGNNAAMRTARAMFSSGFFGCAGFEIEEGSISSSLEEALNKATAKNAEITVMCGSDDDYIENGIEYVRQFKAKNGNKLLVLAGYPTEHIDDFKNAGIDEFIHLRADLIKTLQGFQKKLNII